MIGADDWRLLSGGDALRGQFLEPMTSNEINRRFPGKRHCIFCLAQMPGEPVAWNQVWFLTKDAETCVCADCFADFRDDLDLHETDDFF